MSPQAPGSFDCALAKLTACKSQTPLCPALTLGTFATQPQKSALAAYANSTCTQSAASAGPSGICACAAGLYTSPGCVKATDTLCATTLDQQSPAWAFCDGMSTAAAGRQLGGEAAAAVAGYLASTCMEGQEVMADPCACYEVSLVRALL